jgi:hypothetical protein
MSNEDENQLVDPISIVIEGFSFSLMNNHSDPITRLYI